jgi:hypothetical protein
MEFFRQENMSHMKGKTSFLGGLFFMSFMFLLSKFC